MTTIPTDKKLRLASWAEQTAPSPMQDMLALTARPGLISFGLGLPNQELFPRVAFAHASMQVLHNKPHTLQYGPAGVAHNLKASIVQLMKQRGVTTSEEQIFLTTGAQQAINMLARLLLEPGGLVLAEEVIYTGFLQVLEPFGAKLLTVPTCPKTGMDVDAVEAILQAGQRPSFIYAITDGHNPLGSSMSQAKREKLARLAREYGVPVIEDDPYGFLAYEELTIPPVKALENEWVFYVGSFSKILAPGVRIGWVIVPEALTNKLSIVKESYDINTANWSQHAVAAYLETGELADHLDLLRREYRSRRDTMLRAIQSHFPSETRAEQPSNGMFIWVQLPDFVDVPTLLRDAVEQKGVAFFPGQAFETAGSVAGKHSMRLNFSNATHEQIEQGIQAIGELIEAQRTK
ncbi:GntR family transcriptional regulator [Tumebacillus algifaecis]|uniref:GntR family transcriptional regulator n=1 Tax=Tumebacillus algifaecis TaxID=1214604 RepID=A0A223CXU3_9BACL|nr:PLP-dependent aminotransferase family protein [Tumebacillus algifaecis]ASS74121.1 GntR family transcriptional regulator [Tumebacillus algifaecis]